MESNYQLNYVFTANAFFEANIVIGDQNYLIIYGSHCNGFFCAIVNWDICTEIGCPESISYNQSKLLDAGLESEISFQIATCIKTLGGYSHGTC